MKTFISACSLPGFVDEKTSELDLESRLPDSKYIVSWEKNIFHHPSQIIFDLRLRIFGRDFEPDKMKQYLCKNNLPINSLKSKLGLVDTKTIFQGRGGGGYSYTLIMTSDFFGRNTRIRLFASGGESDVQKMSGLISAVSDYVYFHEMNSKAFARQYGARYEI